MSGVPAPIDPSALPAPQTGGAGAASPRRKGRSSLPPAGGNGTPTILCLSFIWLPTLASIALSFTNWRGITPITANNIVGLKNYEVLFTQYTLFWPALFHNVIWLLFLVFIATPIGIFLAVLLDRE